MAGLEPDEALGQGWIQGIYPEDRNLINLKWHQLVETDGTWDLEYRFQDRQGDITWVHGTATSFYDDDKLVGYIGMNIDITERKQAEQKIKEKAHLQEVVLDSIPAIAMLIRHDTRQVVACNKAAESAGVIVGRPCYQSRHKRSKPCPACQANELLKTGKQQHFQVWEDGCFWDTYWAPVTNDLYLCYAYDHTRQKVTEIALRESEEKSQRMFTDSMVGMSLITIDGTLLQVNDALCDFLGYNKYEFQTLSLKDVTHPDDMEKSLLNVSSLISGQQKSYHMEKRFIHKKGMIKWGLIAASAICNQDGQPLYRLVQVMDITERKEAETALLEYQKKLQAVSSDLFYIEQQQQKKIAGELHDGVCQLLVSCKMSLGHLKDSLEDQGSARYAKEISDTMDHAIKQIRTLTFDLSNPILSELGLCKAIDDLAENYLQKKHNIKSTVTCDKTICKDIALRLSDDLKEVLYRSVRELFVNVVKHAHAAAVETKIIYNENVLLIEVIDDGVGFDCVAEACNRKAGEKMGLFIITERLSGACGHLNFELTNKKGTKAVIEIPL